MQLLLLVEATAVLILVDHATILFIEIISELVDVEIEVLRLFKVVFVIDIII
jgi:hypothetical protein